VIDEKLMGDFFHMFNKPEKAGEGEGAEAEAEGPSVQGMWGILANPFAGVSDDTTATWISINLLLTNLSCIFSPAMIRPIAIS
jgi:hypothetical protein